MTPLNTRMLSPQKLGLPSEARVAETTDLFEKPDNISCTFPTSKYYMLSALPLLLNTNSIRCTKEKELNEIKVHFFMKNAFEMLKLNL